MQQKLFSFLIFLLVSLICVSYSFSQTTDETLTITTYYPAPYGVYNEVRSKRMAIGDNYYDGAQYCWAPAICANPPIATGVNLVVQGNVGIGTTGAGAKLQVCATPICSAGNAIEIGNDVYLADMDTANTISINGAQDSTIGSIRLGSGGGTISGYNANVGIGTTIPNNLLTVGTENNPFGVGPAGDIMVTGGTDSRWGLYMNTVEKIAIEPSGNLSLVPGSGNVGIGTTAPSQKLDVQGNVNITGNLYANGVQAMIFGGNYVVSGGGCDYSNPLTGTCSCPSGFTAYQMGAYGANIYACYR